MRTRRRARALADSLRAPDPTWAEDAVERGHKAAYLGASAAAYERPSAEALEGKASAKTAPRAAAGDQAALAIFFRRA